MEPVHGKVEKRFLKAVRGSGLVPDAELRRALEVQAFAARQGRALPLDRILLKLSLLDREQILGLWRALRYYLWRKEDKLYVKIALQSGILSEVAAEQCLGEQKSAYKHENVLVRVNEIARQRGLLGGNEDRAIVRAMRERTRELTLAPVDDELAARPYERPTGGAAPRGAGEAWRSQARQRDLADLRGPVGSSSERSGSDEDLDALWEQADLDDVELDSQAVELARAPFLDEEDEEDESGPRGGERSSGERGARSSGERGARSSGERGARSSGARPPDPDLSDEEDLFA